MVVLFSLLLLPRHPNSTLFPYTTLFRSGLAGRVAQGSEAVHDLRFDDAELDFEIGGDGVAEEIAIDLIDRKSTRLNSSHGYISYAVFCLKKKKFRTKMVFVALLMSFKPA